MPDADLKSLIALLLLVLFVCVVALICLVCKILESPFRYPYFKHTFDITSKRNVNIEDYIDHFLCEPHNWHLLQAHERTIQLWKHKGEEYLKSCKLKKYRSKQYYAALDDKCAYHFGMVREQTRYRQRNYVKTSYKVEVVDSEWAVSWRWLVKRHDQLGEIGFEATLNEYVSKSQRKLMTPALRQQIKERDNYTCQICGKYMPDEVGLHIDHIMPIAKGGKSIPSNLRVLCSKCNGAKGAKYHGT